MMQDAVAGSDFKVQNLSKRIAEVKTLKKSGLVFACEKAAEKMLIQRLKATKKIYF
jgi:hypothetical protein